MLACTAVSSVNGPRESVICQGLRGELRDRIYEIGHTRDYRAKQLIFLEGEPSEHIFEVDDGVALLSKLTANGRRQIIGFVYPGQLFGLGIVERNSYTAETVTEVRLFQYPRRILDRSLSHFPALGRRFLDLTRSELSMAQDQMLLLGRKTAMEKTASFLMHLSDRNKRRFKDPMRLFVPMTRGEIADFLGLSMETVSRTINRLKQLGIIQLREQCYINVRDLGRLTDFAEDETRFI